MFKQSVRYFALVLTLVALTATVRPAHAYAPDDDPCTDPNNPACVVTSNDPPPTGKVVSQNPNDPALPDSGSADDSKSMDDPASYLIILYGLA